MPYMTDIIQALKGNNIELAENLLRKDCSLLQQLDNDGFTLFPNCKNANTLAWLCEKYSQYNLSIDFPIDSFGGMTYAHWAYLHNCHLCLGIIALFSKNQEYRCWLITRHLTAILGTNYLSTLGLVIDENIAKAALAGTTAETLHIMISTLEESQLNNSYKLQQILTIMRYYAADEFSARQITPAKLINRTKIISHVLFSAGYRNHIFTVCLQQQKNDYILSFYDNNIFAESYCAEYDFWLNNYRTFVRRISVPATIIYCVIETLLNSTKKSKIELYKWLDTLPEICHQPFQYDISLPVDTSFQEPDRCYWHNPKSALHDVFIAFLGRKNGNLGFDIFLKTIYQKVVANFTADCQRFANPIAITRLRQHVPFKHTVVSRRHAYNYPQVSLAMLMLGTMLLLGIGAAIIVAAFGIITPVPPAILTIAGVIGGGLIAQFYLSLLMFKLRLLQKKKIQTAKQPALAHLLCKSISFVDPKGEICHKLDKSRKTQIANSGRISTYAHNHSPTANLASHSPPTNTYVMIKTHQFFKAKHTSTMSIDMQDMWPLRMHQFAH